MADEPPAGPPAPRLHDAPTAELPAAVLYAVLRLRAEVFVVEQSCAYLDPDGRDLEPGCRQLWLEGDDGVVVAAARVLPEAGGATRIGRVVTAAGHRRRGHAGRLVAHALATTAGPWVLAAQAHLARWYGRFGFEVAGARYVEDGIPHVPMRRPLDAARPPTT